MTSKGRIRQRIDEGATVEEVDAEVIANCGLDADQRSALWLYAWSLERDRERQRPPRLRRAPFPDRPPALR